MPSAISVVSIIRKMVGISCWAVDILLVCSILIFVLELSFLFGSRNQWDNEFIVIETNANFQN